MNQLKQIAYLILILVLMIACSSNSVKRDEKISSNVETTEVGMQKLADILAERFSKNETENTLAVMSFSSLDEKKAKFGKLISEELTTRLFNTKKFTIVERNLLEQVAEEHQLSASGMLDENSVINLGKIAGVNYICTGTFTFMDNVIKVNARIISAETGKLKAVGAVNLTKEELDRKNEEPDMGVSTNNKMKAKPIDLKLELTKIMVNKTLNKTDSIFNQAAKTDILTRIENKSKIIVIKEHQKFAKFKKDKQPLRAVLHSIYARFLLFKHAKISKDKLKLTDLKYADYELKLEKYIIDNDLGKDLDRDIKQK